MNDFDEENTPQGRQTLVPGVKPISDADRIKARSEQPMTGQNAPMAEGLFDTGSEQLDMIDWIEGAPASHGQ